MRSLVRALSIAIALTSAGRAFGVEPVKVEADLRVVGKVSCSLVSDASAKERAYRCESRLREPVLLVKSRTGWSAIGRLIESRKLELLPVLEVAKAGRDGEVLFVADRAVVSAEKDRSEAGREAELDLLLEKLEELKPSRKRNGSDLIASFRSEAEREQTELAARAKERQQLEVELQDGQKTVCRKAKGETCAYFDCDPVLVDGKKYDALFNGNALAAIGGWVPQLTLSRTGVEGPELGPARVVSKVYAVQKDGSKRFVMQTPQAMLAGANVFLVKTKLPAGFEQLEDTYAQLVNPEIIGARSRASNGCQSPRVTALLEQESQGMDRLKDLVVRSDMIQIVDFADGKWVSEILPASRTPESACRLREGVFLTNRAEARTDEYVRAFAAASEGAITPEEAKSLFEEMAAQKDIAFGYKRDGCYARAHLMADRMARKGIASEKVWLFGDLMPPESPYIRWGWHVAPAVRVKNADGSTERLIIDPSLASRPVTIEEWVNLAGPMNKGTLVTSGFPPPTNYLPYDHPVVSVSPSAFYMYTDVPSADPKEIEKRMQQAVETNREYLELISSGGTGPAWGGRL